MLTLSVMYPRVVMNDLVLLRERAGVAAYAGELLHAMAGLEKSVRLDRLSETPEGFPLRVASRAYEGARRRSSGGSGARLAGWLVGSARTAGRSALAAYLRRAASLARWELYHEPDAVPADVGVPTIVTVHDLSVLRFPEWHPGHRVGHYERRLGRGLDKAAAVIAVSESTRGDLERFVGVDPRRVTVIPEAPRRVFRVLAKGRTASMRRRLGLPSTYFLFVGTIEPRKNIEGLLVAHAALPESVRRRFPLVLAGGWGWGEERVRDMLSRAPWRGVRHLGYLDDESLVAVCNGASALVYPSFHEGFGLPPLEAMACGVPVISSSEGALAEVLGDAAVRIDPGDPESMGTAMRRLAEDQGERLALRERGLAHVSAFSWENAAKRTLRLYRDVLGG